MNKNQIFFSIALLCSIGAKAGVVVSYPVPEEIVRDVAANQAAVAAALTTVAGSDYRFQSETFSPHGTLAFVTPDPVALADVEDKFPGITEELRAIAANAKHASIDLQANYAAAVPEQWQGQFKFKFADGQERTNYTNVVLKMSDNRGLVALANDVRDTLTTKHGIQHRFPFSSHLTLGKVYRESGEPLDSVVMQNLATAYKVAVTTSAALRVTEFSLNGHDRQSTTFPLFEYIDDSFFDC